MAKNAAPFFQRKYSLSRRGNPLTFIRLGVRVNIDDDDDDVVVVVVILRNVRYLDNSFMHHWLLSRILFGIFLCILSVTGHSQRIASAIPILAGGRSNRGFQTVFGGRAKQANTAAIMAVTANSKNAQV